MRRTASNALARSAHVDLTTSLDLSLWIFSLWIFEVPAQSPLSVSSLMRDGKRSIRELPSPEGEGFVLRLKPVRNPGAHADDDSSPLGDIPAQEHFFGTRHQSP